MDSIDVKDKQKIAIVVLILIILLGGIWMLRKKDQTQSELPSNQPSPEISIPDTNVSADDDVLPIDESTLTAKYILTSSSSSLSNGDIFTVTLNLSAVGELLDGTDVLLHFDPSLFQVQGDIETSSLFQSYPQKIVDNSKGEIKLIAFGGPADPLQQDEQLLAVTFTAVGKGNARVWLDFQKGRTNTTTVVQKQTSKNILGSVEDISVLIN